MGHRAAAMQLEILPYHDDLAPACAELLTESARLDDTLLPISLGDWRAFVARSFNSAGRDFALAREEGCPVAVLMSARYEEHGAPLRNLRVIVHPHHRGRGIARRLMDYAEAQDPAQDVTRQASTMGTWEVADGLLRRRGFAVTTTSLWMQLDAASPDPHPPEGVRLRPARDAAAWCRVHNEAYANDPDFTPLTLEDCRAHRSETRFHLWLAERAGEVVGLCNTEELGGVSHVNSLACARAERGRGTGRAPLLSGLHTLRAEDAGPVRLNVLAENAPAVGLYASVGFRETDRILTWRRAAASDSSAPVRVDPVE